MDGKQEGGGRMTDKRKGAVILLGNLSAQESKPQRNLIGLILASVQAVSPLRGSQRAIMSNACSIAGGDLGGSLPRRTIATPSRGVSLFSGGCLNLSASLRPHSVRGAADGNPSGLMFPCVHSANPSAVSHHLGGWFETNNQATYGV